MKMLYQKHPLITSIFVCVLVLIITLPIPTFASISSVVADGIYSFVTGVFGFFVALSGIAINWSFDQLVFGMGDLIINNGIGVAIDEIWALIRDLFNILFIFGLIYIGFRTILFSEDSQAPRALGFLIAAALLINFSLFITKSIVDVTNVMTYQIYKSINISGGYISVNTSNNTEIAKISGISGAVMQLLNLQSIFSANALPGANDNDDSAPVFTYIFGILVMFVITTFAFATGAIMLMIRFVALIFFLILSPVMFLGWVIPKFAKYSDEYWSAFLKYAFFAPAYALSLFISIKVLKIMHDTLGLTNSRDFAAALKIGNESSMQVILYFFVAIAFMLASVIVGQKMGIAGSSTMISFGKNTVGKLRGVTQGFVGRNSVGRLAGGAQIINNKLEQSKWGRRAKGLLTIGTLGTFDKRTRQRTFKSGTAAKFGGSYSRQDDKDWSGERHVINDQGEVNWLLKKEGGERKKKIHELKRDTNQRIAMQDRNKRNNNALQALENDSTTDIDLITALKDLKNSIKDMTAEEKAALGIEKLTSQSIATQLTESELDSIDKLGVFSKKEMQTIKNARKIGFQNIAEHGSVSRDHEASLGTSFNQHPSTTPIMHKTAREMLMSRGINDVGKLPVEIFATSEMQQFITPAMIAERMKNGISEAEKETIRDNIESFIFSATTTPEQVRAWREWTHRNAFGGQLGIRGL